MEDAHWQRVKELFHEALQRPAEQREAFLHEAIGADEALLAELRSLLAAHAAEDESSPTSEDREPLRRGTPSDAGVDVPGAVIDRYRILQPIGEGGFGTVFLAEQLAPIRRRVAFKILKAGMDTRRVLARFEAEQQALARMDHQNIAKVYDAGATVTGRPYFVMEWIRGVPITTYCDQANLDLRARLELFVDVCSAIQHAHQKGIIHRDIKPSNVLVTVHEGVPAPKVIDFGIAKATDQRLTDKTVFTGLREMIGTPEYMAPEQAEMSGLDVDTRADIYSLGVLLYELLTGTKPFELREVLKSGYGALLEQIRDVEPPKPSARVGAPDAEVEALARHRGTEARKLCGSLRGDLDWIVMKAIAKDRTRRYETANGLALDVERYLRCEPVLAGPPSWRYRLAKLFRKHRASFLAGGAVLLALFGGLVLALWQFRVARENEREAQQSSQRAEESLRFARERENEARASFERARAAEERARELLAAEAAARQEATAHRLAAQAISLVREDASSALHLAIEAARLRRDDESNIALYTALEEHRSLAKMDGHDAASELLEVSADGRLAISADRTMLLIVWDLATRKILYRLDEHEAPVRALGFSPDGASVFSASEDGTVRLWRAADGATAGVLQHPAGVVFAAMDPAGATLLTLCRDGELREWDLRSLEPRRMVQRFEQPALAVARSADLRTVSVLDERMVVWIVDLDADRPALQIALATDAPPASYYNVEQWYHPSVELSRDGTRLLTRNRAGHAALWDARSGERIREYAAKRRFCGPVALSPDARRVFLLRRDPPGKVVSGEIVDAETGERLCELQDPAALAERANAWFSADGTTLLTIVAGTGVLWNSGSGAVVGRLATDPHGLYSPRFVAGEEQILTGSHTGPLYLFARSAYREWRALTLPPLRVRRWRIAATSPDGTRAAIVHDPSAAPSPMLLVDTGNGRPVARLLEQATQSSDAAFSPDARFVAAIGMPEEGLAVVEVATGRVVFRRAIHGSRPCFSPEGRFLSVLTAEQRFEVWDAERGELVGAVPAEHPLVARPSTGGTSLVVPDGPRATVSVWEVASGRRLGVSEHFAFSFDGILTPDRRTLISIANDTNGQIRDADTLQRLATFSMPTADLANVAIAPDGALVAISAQSEVLVYEVPSGRRVARWRGARRFESCVFRPDGEALVFRDGDDTLFEIPLDALSYAESRRSGQLSAVLMARYGLGTEEERRERSREGFAEMASAAGLARAALQVLTAGNTELGFELLARSRAARRRVPVFCDYVEACAHAQRYRAEASDSSSLALGLAALRRFAASGAAQRVVLEGAPLLAPLRSAPEFAEILEKLR